MNEYSAGVIKLLQLLSFFDPHRKPRPSDAEFYEFMAREFPEHCKLVPSKRTTKVFVIYPDQVAGRHSMFTLVGGLHWMFTNGFQELPLNTHVETRPNRITVGPRVSLEQLGLCDAVDECEYVYPDDKLVIVHRHRVVSAGGDFGQGGPVGVSVSIAPRGRKFLRRLASAEAKSDKKAETIAEGTKFRAEDVPAEFRDGGKPLGAPLTTTYLKKNTDWLLLGPHLTKARNALKLTTYIRVGRENAYLYREVLALRDAKTRRQGDREIDPRPEEIEKRKRAIRKGKR